MRIGVRMIKKGSLDMATTNTKKSWKNNKKVVLLNRLRNLGGAGTILRIGKNVKVHSNKNLKLQLKNADHTIKKITPGYFNYLYNKRVASIYSKNIEAKFQKTHVNHGQLEDKAKLIYSKINGLNCYLSRPASNTNVLYGSVTAKDIIHTIEELVGVSVGTEQLIIHIPIKKTGSYRINVDLYEGITAVIYVLVATTMEDAKKLAHHLTEKAQVNTGNENG